MEFSHQGCTLAGIQQETIQQARNDRDKVSAKK